MLLYAAGGNSCKDSIPGQLSVAHGGIFLSLLNASLCCEGLISHTRPACMHDLCALLAATAVLWLQSTLRLPFMRAAAYLPACRDIPASHPTLPSQRCVHMVPLSACGRHGVGAHLHCPPPCSTAVSVPGRRCMPMPQSTWYAMLNTGVWYMVYNSENCTPPYNLQHPIRQVGMC